MICFIYLLISKQKITFKLTHKDYLFYIARALITFVALFLWIYEIKHVGINEATVLSYSGPFWIFLVARYLLGETFSKITLWVIAGNMHGIIIVFHPSINNLSWKEIFASLGSILLWTIYETICKKQTTSQHYLLQTFYVCFFSSIIIAPFAFTQWQHLDLNNFGILSAIELLGVANITSLFLAYSYAPMMTIAPFGYMRFIITMILSSFFTQTIPAIQVFVGAFIILTLNIYLACKKE